MTRRSVTRAPAPSSKPSPVVAELVIQEESDDIDAAKEHLAEALKSLSVAMHSFDDDDLKPRLDAACVGKLVATARLDLANAADAMLDLTAGTLLMFGKRDLADEMFDAIDVVTVIGYALDRGSYPENRGPSTSPIYGTLTIATKLVEELETACRRRWYGIRVKPHARRVATALQAGAAS